MNAYLSLTAAPSRSTPWLRCESPDHTRARQCLRGEASVFFGAYGVLAQLFGLCGGGIDGDVHAEPLKLAHESPGLLFGAAVAVVPVRPQVTVGDAVADDVV